jgi:hypothetical protein
MTTAQPIDLSKLNYSVYQEALCLMCLANEEKNTSNKEGKQLQLAGRNLVRCACRYQSTLSNVHRNAKEVEVNRTYVPRTDHEK